MKSHSRWCYIVLALMALPLYSFQGVIAEAAERTRAVLGGGLMPFPVLCMRDLSALVPFIPLVLIVLFFSSWFLTPLNTTKAVAVCSMVLSAYLVSYAAGCVVIIMFLST